VSYLKGINKKKEKQKIEVIVTQHAIQRFKQRTHGYDLSHAEVQNRLRQAVTNGKKTIERRDHAWEVAGNGLVLVVIFSNAENIATVLTCLGTKRYRNWSRKNYRAA